MSPKILDLMKEKSFVNDERIHSQEHSVEVQIPFLQSVLKDFKLVPIVVGDMNPEELASILEKYVDDDTLVIASSDLSHYYSYEQAVRLDSNCIKAMPEFNYSLMQECEACGIIPILTLMHLAEKQKWRGQLLDYRNSGDTAGDKNRVVGYGSIAFYQGLNKEEQEYLLELSRKTLESYLKTGQKIEAENIPEKTKEISGCFVTLNKNHQLRGCIGHILPQESLYQCVIDNTISAAVHDPRFRPVQESELNAIEIDISVLSVPKKLDYKDAVDLKEKLVPLVDGVVLKKNMRSATYLPQVWEQLPDKEEFLSSLCEKAGLNGDCWTQNPEIQTYRAQVFKEG
jgi:AmmeMemoRadiSam system protein A